MEHYHADYNGHGQPIHPIEGDVVLVLRSDATAKGRRLLGEHWILIVHGAITCARMSKLPAGAARGVAGFLPARGEPLMVSERGEPTPAEKIGKGVYLVELLDVVRAEHPAVRWDDHVTEKGPCLLGAVEGECVAALMSHKGTPAPEVQS